MPQLQAIDLSPREAPPTALEKTLAGFSQRHRENQLRQQDSDALREIYEGFQNRDEQIQDAFLKLQTNPDLSPSERVNQTRNLLELKKQNAAMAKAANQRQQLSPEEKEDRKQRLIREGWPEEEAEEFIDASPGVQQIMRRYHQDLVSRGLRGKNQKNPAPMPRVNQVNQVPQEEGNPAQPTQSELGVEDRFNEEAEPIDENAWPEIPPPPGRTPAEMVKWEGQNQKENNKLLQDTRKKTNATRGIGVRLNILSGLNDKIPDGIGRAVINPDTGEPYAVAQLAKIGVPKEVQQYVKTLNDFLIDAKDYFGSRVTNFDVQSFKSRLPSLLNSADGRRVILKQMQLINELEDLHASTLEDGLKHYGRKASYSDILTQTDNKVAKKEEAIIQKINDLDTASTFMEIRAKNPEKFKNTVLMQDREGNFKSVPKEKVNQAIERKWRVY